MFSTLLLRKTLVYLLIAINLVAPVHTVFACQLMDGRRQYHCCCHEHGHCRHGGGCPHKKQRQAGCCDVSYESAEVGMSSLADGQFFQVPGLEWHPAIPPASFTYLPPIPLAVPPFTTGPPALATDNTPVYLRTLRLRI